MKTNFLPQLQRDLVTDDGAPKKGLRYNSGRRKWGLVHFKSIEPLVEVLEYGAHKYTIYEDEQGKEVRGVDIPIQDKEKYKVKYSGENNWMKGLNKREILESLIRHAMALLDGEENDPIEKGGSGLSHIGHIMCNCMFYTHEMNREK